MKEIICSCGHKMIKVGPQEDTSFGKITKRIKYSCPSCMNIAFLDPEKWNL